MNFIRKLISGLLPSTAASNGGTSKGNNPAEVMRAMRMEWLTRVPGEGEFANDDDVVAVLMEWPMGEETATVLSSAAGDASLYTTSTFGIMGGVGHEDVRKAAGHFITCAQFFLHLASPATEFPYPDGSTLQLFFVTPSGVRVVSFQMSEVDVEKSPARALFSYGQEVLTQLRLVSPGQ